MTAFQNTDLLKLLFNACPFTFETYVQIVRAHKPFLIVKQPKLFTDGTNSLKPLPSLTRFPFKKLKEFKTFERRFAQKKIFLRMIIFCILII